MRRTELAPAPGASLQGGAHLHKVMWCETPLSKGGTAWPLYGQVFAVVCWGQRHWGLSQEGTAETLHLQRASEEEQRADLIAGLLGWVLVFICMPGSLFELVQALACSCMCKALHEHMSQCACTHGANAHMVTSMPHISCSLSWLGSHA